MSRKRPIKVYAKESTVPDIGKGLFAKVDIKKGSIIVEYKGKLRKPHEKTTSSRSNIYFNDEFVLECPANDLASFANDTINFTNVRRQLMKSLMSDEPFYKKHSNTKINATIKINDNLHRAFLIAFDDIKTNEEIFCHYGFMYWYKKEISKIGFLQEDEIEKNGFPQNIFEYPAFLSYIKEFYPDYVRHEIKPFGENHDVIIHLDDDQYVVMMIENFANDIEKQFIECPIEELTDTDDSKSSES
jgi:SET domain-containing protein